ncbi:PAS domain S-box protein [Ancylomarina longa]|uniref:Sensory/regulatory protein RpfC n=1 Tax=Ancylomarina longa TaxID=2487017 RepID=A0A434AXB3_9BACT|nr:PAS domain S-box protein [Ancylomarina longa]RUT79169.1 PAS domain S-box protein [Ancylomarina longa]
MNPLLKKQIEKYLSSGEEQRLHDFIQAIDNAFSSLDTDLMQMSDALAGESKKLIKANAELKRTLVTKTEEIKTTTSRLEFVVDNISEIIFQASRNGDWLYLNPTWEKVTGFKVKKSLDSNVFEYMHPDDIEFCKVKLKRLLTGKQKLCNEEIRLVTVKGSYVWCKLVAKLSYNKDGKMTGLTGSIKDISKRKLLEEEKNRTEEKYKLIFEKSSVVYLIIEGAKFLECNQACLDLFGVSKRENFVGKYVKNFSPEYQHDGNCSEDKAKEMIQIAKETGSNTFDWVHIKENGEEFPVEVSLNSIPMVEGNLLFVVLHDLSERKRVEHELIRARERAEEATRAKAQFLSTMSHEIRTPMNAVIGVTHLLADDNPREDQLNNINILKLSADNLMSLINDILDFSKIEAGRISLEEIDFNFRNLVNNIAAGFESKSKEKGLDFIVNIDPKIPPYLMGDPTRISQVLNNLCSNALKFTERGFVKIKVSMQPSKGDLVQLQFDISDTGIGIPLEKQEAVFDSFSQADSNTTRLYGGTGLGLTITQKLVKIMHGNISVYSEEDKGTTFCVSLSFPVSLKSKPKVNFTSDHFTEINKIKGLHVLVAEDNPMNVLILKQFLKKWDITCEVAENGKLAYDKVQSGDFDMVLMDLQMPVMDGYNAARNIRSLGEDKFKVMPIIAVTASAFSEIRKKVVDAGMTDFVTKPINPEDLYVKLQKYAS